MQVREAAVAGQFYPGSKKSVEQMIERFDAPPAADPVKAIALIVPHAGYIYSGETAAKVFAAVALAPAVIILGPNHRLAGNSVITPKAAIMSDAVWRLPTGDVATDRELSLAIKSKCPIVTEDAVAHEDEHSLEVQLPLLQRFHGERHPGGVKIVPILLAGLTPDDVNNLGATLAEVIRERPEGVTLVASTDFSHYVPHETACAQDEKALAAIRELDGHALLDVVRQERISMCGYHPVAVALEAARRLGATKAEVIDYRTSAAASGDYGSVVGYGGVVIS